jgi:hypothetical protein
MAIAVAGERATQMDAMICVCLLAPTHTCVSLNTQYPALLPPCHLSHSRQARTHTHTVKHHSDSPLTGGIIFVHEGHEGRGSHGFGEERADRKRPRRNARHLNHEAADEGAIARSTSCYKSGLVHSQGPEERIAGPRVLRGKEIERDAQGHADTRHGTWTHVQANLSDAIAEKKRSLTS